VHPLGVDTGKPPGRTEFAGETDLGKDAARALAALMKRPTAEKIIPDMLDPRSVSAVARAVR